MTLRRLSVAAAIVAFAGGGSLASAQTPVLPSVYDLTEVGRVPVAAPCSCLATPFAVTFRPDPRYPSGPAARMDVRDRAGDRRRARPRSAEELNSVRIRADQGLAGEGIASFGVAIDLDMGEALAGDNARTDEEVVKWLHLAASQGNSDAMMFLGYRFSHGLGVTQDYSAAAYWFHRSATSGDHISMVALGLLYAAGRGVPQDWAAAVRWWQRASGKAPLASRFLADAYACGLGIEPDPERAVALYKEGADKGDLSSSTHLGHMYTKGCAQGSDEAARKAYEQAADQGDPEAQVELSELVRQGRGGHPTPYSAYTWARLAELRLPDGPLKTRATAAVNAAVRLMRPEALPSQEALVQSLFLAASKVMR